MTIISTILQVATLKDTIAKRDEEIERLQLQKDIKNGYQGINSEKFVTSSLRYMVSLPSLSKDFKIIITQESRYVIYIYIKCIYPSDILKFSDADNEERLTEISDSGLSVGTETDGSAETNDGTKRSDSVNK